MSQPPATLAGMVKFDPDGFKAMMARIEAEEVQSPHEEIEPDYEYLRLGDYCSCYCHR